MSRSVSAPTSEELLAEWHMRLIAEQHSEPGGGCLGDRVARAERQAWRRDRLRWVEFVLLERAWAEPVVER